MIKIGITERGDAGLDTSWAEKIDKTAYSIIITKNPCFENFQQLCLNHKDKILLHVTITVWGSTLIEPNVPTPQRVIDNVCKLIDYGFPKEQIVWRIDPIIPTNEGLIKANNVFNLIKNLPIKRIRMSVLDAYPHTKERMKNVGYPLDYNTFVAPITRFKQIDNLILNWKNNGFTVEACAEPLLSEPIHIGCVNINDAKLFNINIENQYINPQNRRGCLCCSTKTELLNKRQQCPHQCAYCYWK
jgi:DNA repair photolyase